ncbi:MAG: SPASM domain-containing protein [Oligoflexia bacterium]|nr:SPASM domain-containing protein [Oligoflexia bacterium]
MQKRFKKVYIEISNVCNFQCEFCPEVLRDKKFITYENLEHVLSQVAPLAEEVCYHLMGEPLLHEKFCEFISLAEKLNIPLNITSNGALLNLKNQEALLNSTIRQVNFSLHSFEANFPESDVRSYLKKIFAFTRQALLLRPDLYINFRMWNLKPNEPQSFISETVYKEIKNEFGYTFKNVDVAWRKSKKITGRLYLNFDSRFVWPSMHLPIVGLEGTCYGLKSHIGILADGTVVPCCLDKEGVINLGNIYESNLSEILKSPRAEAIMGGFHKGLRVEELCQKCSFINRFKVPKQEQYVRA